MVSINLVIIDIRFEMPSRQDEKEKEREKERERERERERVAPA